MAEETALIPQEPQVVGLSRLVNEEQLQLLVEALQANAFVYEPEDVELVATAESYVVETAEDYERGFDLLSELGTLQDRITKHHARFKGPLNTLVNVARRLENDANKPLEPVTKPLSKRLGQWKAESDRKDREEAEQKQAAADALARAAQQAKADTLRRIAEQETNLKLKHSFEQEATAIAAVEVHAAPVEVARTAPKIAGGSTRQRWNGEIENLKELLKAFVEGKCYLPEDAIIEALGPFLNKQATSLMQNLGKAFPGCKGVPDYGAVAKRKR